MSRDLARHLRNGATVAERRLWRSLRGFRPEGLRFRRQAPVGRFIADFACHRAKIIVEIDGSQHGEDARAERDASRTAFLEAEGYRVLRFSNGEVMRDSERIAEVVAAEARVRMAGRGG